MKGKFKFLRYKFWRIERGKILFLEGNGRKYGFRTDLQTSVGHFILKAAYLKF